MTPRKLRKMTPLEKEMDKYWIYYNPREDCFENSGGIYVIIYQNKRAIGFKKIMEPKVDSMIKVDGEIVYFDRPITN